MRPPETEARELVMKCVTAALASKLEGDEEPMRLVLEELRHVSMATFLQVQRELAMAVTGVLMVTAKELHRDLWDLWQEVALLVAEL